MSQKNKPLTIDEVINGVSFDNIFVTQPTGKGDKQKGGGNYSEKQFQMVKTVLNRIKTNSKKDNSGYAKKYYSDRQIAEDLASGELKMSWPTKLSDGTDATFYILSDQIFRQNQTFAQFSQFKGREVNFNRDELSEIFRKLILKVEGVAIKEGLKITRPAKPVAVQAAGVGK